MGTHANQLVGTGGAVCVECGAPAELLASVWNSAGLFAPPAGEACFACSPEAFGPWERELVGAHVHREAGAAQ